MRKWTKHRTWRKLHLSLEGDSQLLTSMLLTNKDVVDRELYRACSIKSQLLSSRSWQTQRTVRKCYRAIAGRGARAVIPPRKGAVRWTDEYLKERNNNLRAVQRAGAAAWKKKVGSHRRSLGETAIYRRKQLFTDKLRSREGHRQATEVVLRGVTLNRMTELGMPQSYSI